MVLSGSEEAFISGENQDAFGDLEDWEKPIST